MLLLLFLYINVPSLISLIKFPVIHISYYKYKHYFLKPTYSDHLIILIYILPYQNSEYIKHLHMFIHSFFE